MTPHSIARHRGALAASIALAIATALATSAARADFSDEDSSWKARFDLGIDIGWAGRTAASIQGYLATLPAETQRAIMNGCEHYMLYPSSAQSPDTLPFCSLAVGVNVPTGTGKTKIVEFGAVPNAPQLRLIDPGPRPVFRLYPDDDENGHP